VEQATQPSGTLGRTRLSFADAGEIDEFVATLERYERGELTPDQWRAFRLVRGTYGQRQTSDAQMLRVKIPQGILAADQLQALADVGEAYSRGFGHITTRQNLQFHFMRLHDVEPAMRRLADAGLTTREACGSAVRNVTACPLAGVAAGEVFDVTPYAEAFSRHFLRHPLGSALPRKFKVAFEGCPEDHALLGMHDIGWRARVRDGRRGFRVTIGGGTSILCKSGDELFEFLPAAEILDVAEAILRVFQRLGDYKHKQRNRMKFLIKELGWEAWRAEFLSALSETRSRGGARLPFDPEAPPVEETPLGPRAEPPTLSETTARAKASRLAGPGIVPEVRPFLPVMNGDFGRWRKTNVRAQKQAGYVVVSVTLPLGDVTSQQLRLLGDLALAYGDGGVRVTSDQDALLRWVRAEDVGDLYRRLAAAGLGLPDAHTVADVVSCPGAESCKLAVTQSRGLGRLLGERLRSRPDLVDAAADLDIKISGCPNGCGRHHVAGIGFQGSVRKLGSKVVPQYFVLIGGGVEDDGVGFGRLAAKIPARRISEAVERLIGLYRSDRTPAETATAFFKRLETARAKALLADLEELTPESALPADYVDLGETSQFKVGAMEGECSA
jgi:sulfite reductase (NADPH) hemoprotein beta-component